MEASELLSLLIKLVVSPIVVFLSTYLFLDVNYAHFYQAILVGWVLAVVGYIMEVLILRRGAFWINNALDFVVSTVILYASAFFFAGALVTFVGALLTVFVLTVIEYFLHKWLIQSGRMEKA